MSLRPANNPIIPATAANQNVNSQILWARDIVRISVQAVVTGSTADGTLQLQFSNDQATGAKPEQFTPTNWSNLGSAVTVAAAGVFAIDETECSYEYLRLVWTDTSSGANNGNVSARSKSMGL